jgi:hypothetical protein
MIKCWFNKYMNSNRLWTFLTKNDFEVWCFTVLSHVLFIALNSCLSLSLT